MKNLIYSLFLIVCTAYSQNDEIKKYEVLKLNIQNRIAILTDSVNKIDIKINAIKSRNVIKSISDSTLSSVARKDAKLKKFPSVMSEIVATLGEDKEVTILDYENEFFGVCIDSICGYMNEMWINKTPEIIEFIRFKKNEKSKLEQLNYERQSKLEEKESSEMEKKYIKKYGAETYKKLKNKYYWIGMTKEMATIALGIPETVNRTVGSWGVHEQWVYHKLYLYFENGKLSSYQN